MNIEALQQRLRQFAAARDWQPYHAPKNLAMALMVETAELMEHFQWSTLPESRGLARDPIKKEGIADEIADVLLYLLQLADHTGVDIEKAVEAKLEKNALKHPPKHPQLEPKPAPKHDAARVHVLVDWENVQPAGEDLQALVPECTHVWLMHAPAQTIDDSSHRQCFGADRVVKVPRSGAGKNALDFQLCYYTGYLTASKGEGRFVVVSNDKGYDPMVEHANMLKFDVRRIGFQKAVRPAIAVTKPPVVVDPDPSPTAAHMAWRLLSDLRSRDAAPFAFDTPQMQALAVALVKEPVKDKAALAQRACKLAAIWVQRNGGLAPQAAQTTLTVAVPEVVAVRVPATPVVQSTPAASKKQAAVAKPGAAAPAHRSVLDLAKRVLASLQKMTKNRPSNCAGLLKMIATHTGKQADSQAVADQVLALLEKRKDVLRLPDGKRVRYPRLESQAAKLVKAQANQPVPPKK